MRQKWKDKLQPSPYSKPLSQEDFAGRLVRYAMCNHAKQRNDVALWQEYRVMGAQSASGGDV